MNRWLMAAMAAAAGVSLAFSSGPAAGKDKRAKRDRPEAPPVQGADGSTPTLDIYFIDVEGGAATLIVTPQRESVLIDSGWPGEGGRDAKRIESAARSDAGLTQIDHYITTHWHTDHYGGIENLAKLMPVRHFWPLTRRLPAGTQGR
jgi:glyoxylase-like metal-dependent hydrolase (beta-lactamase superfamily II)